MVRELVQEPKKSFDGEKSYSEFAGLSTDSKPTTGIVTGSLFLEVNTGNIYAFDETSSGTWTKICELGGGS